MKRQTRLFISLSSIVAFCKQLHQRVPCEAENWHALSQEHHHFITVDVPLTC